MSKYSTMNGANIAFRIPMKMNRRLRLINGQRQIDEMISASVPFDERYSIP